MDYFDLHCDTPFELYRRKSRLKDGDTHITSEKLSGFRKYAQIMDIWSQNGLAGDICYGNFFKIYDNFMSELKENPEFSFCRSSRDLAEAEKAGGRAVFLGVEGANLLSGDISRLDVLYSRGVRFLTLTWAGESCIGGAHGTETGLSEFGREVVLRCEKLGITVDVSHGSDLLTDEATEICASNKIPAIASHCNSRACRNHSRNLTDNRAKRIAAAGGIIGISLARNHLATEDAKTSDVMRHIAHYLSLGLEKNLCFGCDMDGTDLPDGMRDVSSMGKLYDEMISSGFGRQTADDVFYGNAHRFFGKYM